MNILSADVMHVLMLRPDRVSNPLPPCYKPSISNSVSFRCPNSISQGLCSARSAFTSKAWLLMFVCMLPGPINVNVNDDHDHDSEGLCQR